MGDNLPMIGERVLYFHTDTSTMVATIIAVTFWDLVDLRLSNGRVLRDIRRTIEWLGESNKGRFRRMM